MLISEVISELNKIKEKQGDLRIMLWHEYPNDPNDPCDILIHLPNCEDREQICTILPDC